MPNQKIVTEAALSAIASDIKNALSGKANSDDVYLKSQTYNRTEIDNALDLKADKSELYNVYPTDQESGAIAHFTDGAENIPVKSLVSQIVAVESGSGEKSPENPYTISGFDSGIVSVCGVNLWEENCKNGYYNVSTGDYVYNANQLCCNDFISVKPNTNYYCYKGSYSNQGECLFYDENKTFINYIIPANFNNHTFTTPNNCHYITFNLGSSYGTTYNNDISINYPSADTQYHAYNGNTYTFTFGQTVYGGRLNVTTGVLTIDTGYKSTTWSNFFDETVLGTNARRKIAASGGVLGYSICNVAPYLENHSQDSNHFYVASGVCWLFMPVGTAGTTPIEFTYKLGTPITVQLTPTEVKTLLGENNIFSNCGDVEVDYRADIGLYIDKKISSLAQA